MMGGASGGTIRAAGMDPGLLTPNSPGAAATNDLVSIQSTVSDGLSTVIAVRQGRYLPAPSVIQSPGLTRI